MRTLATVGVIALLTAGCYAHPGAPVNERLRAANLPYVEEVDYQPMEPISDATGDWIRIFLRADATDAQLAHLFCDIVTPAAIAALGEQVDPGLIVYKGVTWHPPMSQPLASGEYRWWDGETMVQAPACPA